MPEKKNNNIEVIELDYDTEKLLPDRIGPFISLEYNGLKNRLIKVIEDYKSQMGGVRIFPSFGRSKERRKRELEKEQRERELEEEEKEQREREEEKKTA